MRGADQDDDEDDDYFIFLPKLGIVYCDSRFANDRPYDINDPEGFVDQFFA